MRNARTIWGSCGCIGDFEMHSVSAALCIQPSLSLTTSLACRRAQAHPVDGRSYGNSCLKQLRGQTGEPGADVHHQVEGYTGDTGLPAGGPIYDLMLCSAQYCAYIACLWMQPSQRLPTTSNWCCG